MRINPISCNNKNFGMNWKTVTVVAPDKLALAQCIGKLTLLAPKKSLYFKEIGDKVAKKMDDGALGYLHFFDKNAFCYRVGGKKYPPDILEAIEKCLNSKTKEEAINIVNTLIDKHNAMLNIFG